MIEVQNLVSQFPASSAMEIYRDLEQRHGAGRVPMSLRTVQRLVAELRRERSAERWALTDGSTEDAAAVLELVDALLISARVGHAPRRPTKRQAELYVRIRSIEINKPAPAPTWSWWPLAAYAALGDDQQALVEELLVLRPWAEGPTRLQTMVKGGMVDERAEALWRSIRAGQPGNGGK